MKKWDLLFHNLRFSHQLEFSNVKGHANQPQGIDVSLGSNISLRLTASGSNLVYQVRVSNSLGTVASANAEVVVDGISPPSSAGDGNVRLTLIRPLSNKLCPRPLYGFGADIRFNDKLTNSLRYSKMVNYFIVV
jgi:hypothetical protein